MLENVQLGLPAKASFDDRGPMTGGEAGVAEKALGALRCAAVKAEDENFRQGMSSPQLLQMTRRA